MTWSWCEEASFSSAYKQTTADEIAFGRRYVKSASKSTNKWLGAPLVVSHQKPLRIFHRLPSVRNDRFFSIVQNSRGSFSKSAATTTTSLQGGCNACSRVHPSWKAPTFRIFSRWECDTIIFQCCKRGQGLVVAKLPQADQQSGHQVDAAIMAIEISHFNITSRIPTLSPLFRTTWRVAAHGTVIK